MVPEERFKFMVPLFIFSLLIALSSAAYPDSATVGMKFSNNKTKSVYIDGQTLSEGTYSSGELDFPYVVGDNPFLLGIVPDGSFNHLKYVNSSNYIFETSLSVGSSYANFYLPFTEGDYQDVEGREQYINPGFLGTSLLEYMNPNFAYDLLKEKTIRISLSYSNKLLSFPRISSGLYELRIENKGLKDDKLFIEVEKQ